MVSYYGGMFGEFICSQISNDKNFYDAEVEITDNNRYVLKNPFKTYTLNLKAFDTGLNTKLPPQLVDRIDNDFSEYNLCYPTHTYKEDMEYLNLPRLKIVRLRTKHNDILFLAYIVGWIKSLTTIGKVNPRFTNEVEHKLNSITRPYYDKILERGYFYWFEKLALKHGIVSIDDFIEFWWRSFRQYNNLKWDQWTYIDIGSLIKDYDNVKEEWNELFNLDSDLDKAAIEEYHANNLQLIEDTFNKSFDELGTSWQELLLDWINTNTDSILDE